MKLLLTTLFSALLFVHILPAFAKENHTTLKTKIGSKDFTFEAPKEYCFLDKRKATDLRQANSLTGLFARSNLHFVQQFAKCDEFVDWRSGIADSLDEYGQILTHYFTLGDDFKGNRQQLVNVMCTEIRKTSAKRMKLIAEQAQKNVKQQMDLQLKSNNIFKIMAEDETGCYFSSETVLKLPKRNKVISGITATTLIKGKIIQINLYAPKEDEKTKDILLATQKKLIANLIATNK